MSPSSTRVFPSYHPPAVKRVPIACLTLGWTKPLIVVIITSYPVVAQVGLRVPTPLLTGAVSARASTASLQLVCAGPRPCEVAPRGPGFARGAWPFIGQLPNFLILCASVCACVHTCTQVCTCGCV